MVQNVSRSRTGGVILALSLTALFGCASGRAVAPATMPSVPGATAAIAEPVVPQLQRMRVTLAPSVRVVTAITNVSYEAPEGGVRLQRDAPYSLPVTASGTGNLRGETWLEREGTITGKTPLKYDTQNDLYHADILLDATRVQAGDYNVMAALESVEPITDPRPLHVELGTTIPSDVLTEVEVFRAFFDTNVYTLRDDDRARIQELASKLRPYGSAIVTISVEGHCDTRGEEIHNLELGSSRASSLMKIFGESLPEIPIGIHSLGSDNPDPPGNTDEDWAKNRWARIRIESK